MTRGNGVRALLITGALLSMMQGGRLVVSSLDDSELEAHPDYKACVAYDSLKPHFNDARDALEYHGASSGVIDAGNGFPVAIDSPASFPDPSEAKDSLEGAIELDVDDFINEDITAVVKIIPDGYDVQVVDGEPVGYGTFSEERQAITDIQANVHERAGYHCDKVPQELLSKGFKQTLGGMGFTFLGLLGLGFNKYAAELIKECQEQERGDEA